MCGIFCCIVYNQNTFLNEISKKGSLSETCDQFADYEKGFLSRGPDCFQEVNVDVSEFTLVRFAGSVLWTQGEALVPQPVVDEDGNVLLWNGDIFSGPLAGENNDTQALSEHLLQVTRDDDDIPAAFSQIGGPYSFIYFHKAKKRIYFGRDVIGRHSLVLYREQGITTICSIGHRRQASAVEIPAVGIFWFDLIEDGIMPLVLHPWSHFSQELIELKMAGFPGLPDINVLDSLQSSIKVYKKNFTEPTEEDLSMWVVIRQDLSMSQLMDKLSASDSKTRIKRTMTSLSEKEDVQILVNDLLTTLKEALKVRLQKLPPFCKDCVQKKLEEHADLATCSHSKVAILFSGGLDSAVLATLTASLVPEDEPIDLLNVAFERSKEAVVPRLGRRPSSNGVYSLVQEMTYKVPDRETGLQTLSELKTLFPQRKWNFVEINVTQEELKLEREEQIADLIHPLHTVLDDSLGCALWFATRGQGMLTNPKVAYTSPARIILSGIGADEQLGGYMRHRTTLAHKGGWPALERELNMELSRIGERNLGRDDRMTSSHGRQCRMPYLDENLVNFLSFLPPWHKCNPVESMQPGLGDKLLLRLVAWKLGLRAASNLPKRAMQFGSRIANSSEKAGDVSARLATVKTSIVVDSC